MRKEIQPQYVESSDGRSEEKGDGGVGQEKMEMADACLLFDAQLRGGARRPAFVAWLSCFVVTYHVLSSALLHVQVGVCVLIEFVCRDSAECCCYSQYCCAASTLTARRRLRDSSTVQRSLVRSLVRSFVHRSSRGSCGPVPSSALCSLSILSTLSLICCVPHSHSHSTGLTALLDTTRPRHTAPLC